MFEAPRKDQQAWLIRRVGTDVNLGNVAPRDVLGLEALRLGLRADTMIEASTPVARSTRAMTQPPAVGLPGGLGRPGRGSR